MLLYFIDILHKGKILFFYTEKPRLLVNGKILQLQTFVKTKNFFWILNLAKPSLYVSAKQKQRKNPVFWQKKRFVLKRAFYLALQSLVATKAILGLSTKKIKSRRDFIDNGRLIAKPSL